MNRGRLKGSIRQVKEFLDLWIRFHEMYQEAADPEKITPEKEKAFLELKSLLARRYQAMLDTLGLPITPDDRTFDVIAQVQSLSRRTQISEMQMSKIESDWNQSHVSLNKLLGSLEAAAAGGHRPSILREPMHAGVNWGKVLGNAVLFVIVVALGYYFLVKRNLLGQIDLSRWLRIR